jgi:methyl-accepting chemotaxis protein
MAANRITDIKPGLSYSNYKNEFMNCTQVTNNTSLMGKFDDYWKTYNSKEPTTTTTGNEIEIPKMSDIQNFSYSVKSQTTGKSVIEPEIIIETISDIVKGFFGGGSTMTGGFKNLIGVGITTALEGIKDILKEQVKLHNDVNSALSISGDMSQALRDNIRDTIQPAAAFGYELRDVSDTVIKMMQDTGRLSSFSAEVMNKLPSVSRAFVDDMGVLGGYFRQYELVGISAENTIDSIEKGGESSLRLGLNARKVVKETADNIGKINEYGFSKGVEGLNRMVQKSIEFRMSMSTAFKIAEDVMDPDVAINLSANLQALGGAIGDLGDPLKMMYMATNNVEGLQDALIGVAGSLATYNKEQGKFELTGVNIRKARELAKQLGIDYKELSNSAIASAERSVAATELLARGLDLKPEQKEFLTNISRMKDGRMVIDVSNMSDQFQGLKEIALGDLTENQKEILLKNQEAFKAMSTEDIAKGQYTETQKLALSVSEIGAMLKIQFAKAINPSLRGVDNQISKANEYISQALKGKNEGGKEVERIKSEAQKIANDELKVKTEKEKPIKVDVSKKEDKKEETGGNTGGNSVMTVKHEFKDSSVVFDFSRQLFEESMTKNPKEYTTQIPYAPGFGPNK